MTRPRVRCMRATARQVPFEIRRRSSYDTRCDRPDLRRPVRCWRRRNHRLPAAGSVSWFSSGSGPGATSTRGPRHLPQWSPRGASVRASTSRPRGASSRSRSRPPVADRFSSLLPSTGKARVWRNRPHSIRPDRTAAAHTTPARRESGRGYRPCVPAGRSRHTRSRSRPG